jgi:hypothetical protein
MGTRRQFLTTAGLGVLGGTAFAVSGDNRGESDGRDGAIPDGSASKDMITPEADNAIKKGLQYLRDGQNRDGSFGDFRNAYQGNVAVTSLGALAFMAAGNQPNRGPDGEVVTKALKFVLSMENKDGNNPGFLHNPIATPHGPMYGHGFGTLFLAEVSGMVHEKALREEVQKKLHRAVELILRSQNSEGGWRYLPRANDADISVTICQVMALRAARNAGIAVPKSAIDKCVAYVKRCQDGTQGWFRYMAQGGGGGGQQAFARTAAGVCALYSAGIYDGREIESGLKVLRENMPGKYGFGRGGQLDMHYFYGHYYAVQAMWTRGGSYWKEWFPAIREELIARQQPNGCWVDQICSHYGTAMACIILQIPNNYLPILQK